MPSSLDKVGSCSDSLGSLGLPSLHVVLQSPHTGGREAFPGLCPPPTYCEMQTPGLEQDSLTQRMARMLKWIQKENEETSPPP